jgi:hypothetical protein
MEQVDLRAVFGGEIRGEANGLGGVLRTVGRHQDSLDHGICPV